MRRAIVIFALMLMCTSFLESINLLMMDNAGCSVTSWYRSEARNNVVGGAKNSKHLVGKAVDVVCDFPSQYRGLFDRARSLKLDYINEGTHVHVQSP